MKNRDKTTDVRIIIKEMVIMNLKLKLKDILFFVIICKN